MSVALKKPTAGVAVDGIVTGAEAKAAVDDVGAMVPRVGLKYE